MRQDFSLLDLPNPESLTELNKETNYVVMLGSYEEMLGLVDWASRARSHMQINYFDFIKKKAFFLSS